MVMNTNDPEDPNLYDPSQSEDMLGQPEDQITPPQNILIGQDFISIPLYQTPR